MLAGRTNTFPAKKGFGFEAGKLAWGRSCNALVIRYFFLVRRESYGGIDAPSRKVAGPTCDFCGNYFRARTQILRRLLQIIANFQRPAKPQAAKRKRIGIFARTLQSVAGTSLSIYVLE